MPKMIMLTEAGGKTKRVTASGISEPRTTSFCIRSWRLKSHEAAAKAFLKNIPICTPQSSIEIMYVRPMGGMLE